MTRRIRYSGTHPRKSGDKYKELNAERYPDEIAKIKKRGATPFGSHRPICVNEILEIFNLKSDHVVLDATLGFGGHAAEILKKIPRGKLIGLDQDPIELPKTEKRLRDLGFENFITGNANFRDAVPFLNTNGIDGVDRIIADLGVSSMQIDDVSRGFTFKKEAVFDLRMNPEYGEPAFLLMNRLSMINLADTIAENSDEPRSGPIAEALKKARPKTTTDVAQCVRKVMSTFSPRIQEEEGDSPIRRVFQSLRIAVNDEFAALEEFLDAIPDLLNKRGRIAIISFHSGEDRRVKKAFQTYLRSGVFTEISTEVIRPSVQEQFDNPRSKSAKLRWGKIR